MATYDFELDSRLDADSLFLMDWPLCRVLRMNDRAYPWLILVPRLPDLVEIIDLDPNEQNQLTNEIDDVARKLKSITECDKLNIAALGNQVPQLHVHIIGRRHSDAAWPKPVWGAVPPITYDPAVRDGFIGALRRALHVMPAGG